MRPQHTSDDEEETGNEACAEREEAVSDQELHLRTIIERLERENAALRAKLARLDGLTNWVCSCGGTDCKGQEENAALRAALDAARKEQP
jgi:predicted RNase H-like nuclease (RuvC/YqgF family)